MPTDGDGNKDNVSETRSGKRYTRTTDADTANAIEGDFEIASAQGLSTDSDMAETPETIAKSSERDPTVIDLIQIIAEMRGEMNRMRAELDARKTVIPTRPRTAIRYGDEEIPVTLETDSAIGGDKESDDGEHDCGHNACPCTRRKKGGGGGGDGITLRIPRSGWVKDPFEDIKFYGDSDRQNPVIFLRQFENVVKYENISREQQLYDFRRVLKGAAKHWIEATDPKDIETAKTLFMEMYWGRAAQKTFKKHLHNGRYQPNRGTSMAEYALNMVHQCQMLKPRMSDNDIIELLEDHFEERVAQEIRPSTVTNINDLIILLKRIESTRNKKPYEDDLYKYNANQNASKAGNNSKSNNNSGRTGANDSGRNKNNDNPNPKNAGENQTRSYPNAQRGRYNQGQRYTYPQNYGKSTVEITDVTDEEAKVTPKAITYPRTANSWKKTDEHGDNKSNYRDSRDSGQKRISTVTGEDDEKSDTDQEKKEEKSLKYEPNLSILRTKRILEDLDESMKEAHKAKKFREWDEPIITISFKNLKINALVDTGAQVSALTKELFGELQAKGEKMDILLIRRFLLRGAFTEKGAVISNKVSLSFEYNGDEYTHELYLVEKMAYRLILGIDFLTKNKMQMSIDDRLTVTFKRQTDESKVSGQTICSLTRKEADEVLEEIIQENEEVFRDEIGIVTHYTHKINFISDKPYKKKTYPIPEKHMGRVIEYMRHLEDTGIITKAATQYINPLVVVIKKNGDVRLCLDARELNKRTQNDHAQPPTIDDVFRRIGQRKFFTTLDISQAFWQIPLTSDSKQYTGFLFNGQTYVFNRMPFGLKTAGASFTRAMDRALGDDTGQFTIVYLDDILIASNTLEEHLEHIKIVLNKLKSVGFRLNKEKCEFIRNEIKFLGHTFSEIEAEINQETRQAIQNFQRPTNKKQLQSFLGLVNWDRRFIKNLSRLVRPLEELLQKGKKFVWTDKEQRAFAQIKSVFIEAPSLYLIRPGYKFGIYVDAATTGARLYQYRDGLEEKFTVAYASRSLKGAETRYTITELEGLALTWALRKWHVLLLGRHVRVHTDHKALQFLSTCVQNNNRIARWFAFLQEFELDIQHIPGKQNEVADALSRSTKTNSYQGDDEKTIALIRDRNDGADANQWIQMIHRAQLNDEEVQYRLREYREQCFERDGLVRVLFDEWESDKIFVPEKLTWRLIQSVHKFLLHYGTDKIADFAKKYFYANNLNRIVRDVVASCTICQATKHYTRASRGVEYYELPNEPGKTVSIDIFGPLPVAKHGFKYVLVVMDQFSKHTKLYPMTNQKLDAITDKLENEYFPEIGIPREILSDNGGQFITARWAQFADRMGFEIRKTSPYNPQSNPVERVMRELGRIIRAYASHNHTMWLMIIPRAERVINETTHASTGYTPSELQTDEDNQLDLPEQLRPRVREQQTWQRKIEKARDNLRQAAVKRKLQTDKHGERAQYQVGDLVWLKVHRLSDQRKKLTKKIYLVYDGPYRILEVIRRNAYLLGTLEGRPVTSANSRQLKPHREEKLNRQENEEDPMEERGEASEDDNNGEGYSEADSEDVDHRRPEDREPATDSERESDQEEANIQYNTYRSDTDDESCDYNEQYNFGYNEPGYKVYDSERESEASDAEDGYLKQNEDKQLSCQDSNDMNKYLTHYEEDGHNKKAVYESHINEPDRRGKAKIILRKTKNSQSVTYKSRIEYDGDNTLPKYENGEEHRRNKRLRHERLPEVTMGVFYVEHFDETRVKVENGEEWSEYNEGHSFEQSAEMPRRWTRATKEDIARDGDNKIPTKHTPEEDVRATTKKISQQEKISVTHNKWGDAIARITEIESSENIIKNENIKIELEDIINDDNQSDNTLSLASSDSLYEKLSDLTDETQTTETDKQIRQEHSYCENYLEKVTESREDTDEPETRVIDNAKIDSDNKNKTKEKKLGLKVAKMDKEKLCEPCRTIDEIKIAMIKNNKRLLELLSLEYAKQISSLSIVRGNKQHGGVVTSSESVNQWALERIDQLRDITLDRIDEPTRVSEDQSEAEARGPSDSHLDIRPIVEDASKHVRKVKSKPRGDIFASQSTELVGDRGTEVISDRRKSECLDMERRELTLASEFLSRCKKQERQERRSERLRYLEEMVAAMPTPEDDVPSEEEKLIEEKIKMVEKIYNQRDKMKKMFRVQEQVINDRGGMSANIDASIRVSLNPSKIDLDEDAIFVSFVIKGNEIKAKTSVIKRADIEHYENIEIINEAEDAMPDEPQPGTSTAVPSSTYQRPTEEGRRSVTILPEDENAAGAAETRVRASEAEPRRSVSKKKKRSRQSHSEHSKSHKNRESEKEGQKKSKRRRSESDEDKENQPRKRKNKTDLDDPLAIDGRRKPDLSNRIRIKGKLGGYKEGFRSTAKRPRDKQARLEAAQRVTESKTATVSVSSAGEEETTAKKMSSRDETTNMDGAVPEATSTPRVRSKNELVEELLRCPTIRPYVALDALPKADIDRARSMRPTAPTESPPASTPAEPRGAAPEADERKPSSREPTPVIQEAIADDEIPSSQAVSGSQGDGGSATADGGAGSAGAGDQSEPMGAGTDA